MSPKKQFPPYLTLMITAAITTAITANAEASHPYHVSKSEVSWNSKTGNFEVAMCVWPADLEKALATQTRQAVDLDKVENLDELMATYVGNKFRVCKSVAPDEQSKAASIRWVGHERNHKEAWLFFEVQGDKKQSDWTIENRIFFELNKDQLNQIQFSVGRHVSSFISSANTPSHAISHDQTSKSKDPKNSGRKN
ncbi:MAG: hypothetical protein P8J27_00985 [Mariniblastus sp.]|nr:hypothetical protein [Mariniblastus sp.]